MNRQNEIETFVLNTKIYCRCNYILCWWRTNDDDECHCLSKFKCIQCTHRYVLPFGSFLVPYVQVCRFLFHLFIYCLHLFTWTSSVVVVFVDAVWLISCFVRFFVFVFASFILNQFSFVRSHQFRTNCLMDCQSCCMHAEYTSRSRLGRQIASLCRSFSYFALHYCMCIVRIYWQCLQSQQSRIKKNWKCKKAP